DRLIGRAVVAVPGVCPAMQRRSEARLAMLELDAQELAEEMVEAVPLIPVVERNEEQIRSRQRAQLVAGALLLEHRVTERARKPLEDRRTEHQRLQRRIVSFEHLVDEEVDDVPARATEPADEGVPIVGAPKREGCEVETRGPALGPFDEIVYVRRREP